MSMKRTDSSSPAPGVLGSGYSTRTSRHSSSQQQQQQHIQQQQIMYQQQQQKYTPQQQQMVQPHPSYPPPQQQQQRYTNGNTSSSSSSSSQYRYNGQPNQSPYNQGHNIQPHQGHPHQGHPQQQMIISQKSLGTYSTYAARIKEANSALVLPLALGRRAKRAVVSMAESDEDDWDFDDEGRSSPRGAQAKLLRERERERERIEKEKKKLAFAKRMRRTRHPVHSQQALDAVADHDAILVPIRLDIDTDEYKLRDTFTWNVNEQLMSPENFAEILCDDLDLNLARFVPEIATSIRNQIAEFEPVAEVEVPVEGSRAVIQLDLYVGGINLRDRFEWDVASNLTPEEFARTLAADLGIGGEFVSIIAHEIHDQLYRFKQDRLLDHHGFDTEQALYSGFRPNDEGEHWSPSIETLTTEEYEKIMEDRERQVRRNRRETSRIGRRKGGPTDRDREGRGGGPGPGRPPGSGKRMQQAAAAAAAARG